MTLTTVPQYDSDRISVRDGRAVVIGAGMAGLLAARVLTNAFDEVTILERDSFPEEPVARRGVPQGRHVHVMLLAGKATLEDTCSRTTGRTCSRPAHIRCHTTPRRGRSTSNWYAAGSTGSMVSNCDRDASSSTTSPTMR